MFEDPSQPMQSSISTARIILAVILFALAVVLGVWVLTIVNETITDTKHPAMLQKICPEDTKPFDINTPAGRFELPKPAFTALAYFVLYLFLIIPMSITLVLIKGGVSLLSPDSTRQMRQLIDAIRRNIAPKQ